MADGGVNIFDLAARISVDSKGVDQNLTATQKKVIELSEKFKQTEKAAQSSAAGISKAARQMGESLGPRQGPFAAVTNLKEKFKQLEGGAKSSFANITKSGVTASRDIQGALSTLSPQLAGIAGAVGPLTAVAAGLIAMGAAGAGIYKLATFSAQLGSEIFDLSQKVNFSAETLSGLKIAAELSGGSLASLSTSLGIFDRNLEEAHQKGSEMSRVFKVLKIDINDNEKALRNAFTALAAMPPGYQQTAIAMKLFGRSGKEILGVLKETNGDIDSFIERMREMGLVITSEGAKKADEFGDKLTLLRNKLEAVGRQIGQELIPIVEKAASDAENWLKRNQGEIQKTAKEIAGLIDWVYKAAKAIADVSPVTFTVRIVRQIVGGIAPGPQEGDVQEARDYRSGGTQRYTYRGGQWEIGGRHPMFRGVTGGAGPVLPAAPRLDFGGGGGGGGKGKQRDELEALKNTLMGLNAELRRHNVELLGSTNLTAEAAEKEKILANVMSSLSAKTKMAVSEIKDVDEALKAAISALPKRSQETAQALVAEATARARQIQEQKVAIDLDKQATDLTKRWAQEIRNSISGADQYTVAIQGLEKAYGKYGLTLSENIKTELESLAVTLRQIEAIRQLTRERRVGDRPRRFGNIVPGEVLDLGGGSFFQEGGAGEGRPRIATAELQFLRDQEREFRERMRTLAGDLTYMLDRATYEGFSGGIERGLAAFAISGLEIIRRLFLGEVEKSLRQAFTNAFSDFSGGGGGGFLSGLLNFGISAIGGLFGGGRINLGGGSSFTPGGTGATRPRIVGRAEGGPIQAGLPYRVHRDEVIVSDRDAMVFNRQQQAAMGPTIVNNFYFNSPRDATSRDTEAQVSRMMARILQRRALQ